VHAALDALVRNAHQVLLWQSQTQHNQFNHITSVRNERTTTMIPTRARHGNRRKQLTASASTTPRRLRANNPNGSKRQDSANSQDYSRIKAHLHKRGLNGAEQALDRRQAVADDVAAATEIREQRSVGGGEWSHYSGQDSRQAPTAVTTAEDDTASGPSRRADPCGANESRHREGNTHARAQSGPAPDCTHLASW
jgi:hypothetical protein